VKVLTSLPRVLYYLALASRRVYWDKERMRRFQDKRFRSIVRYAYENVPFYRRLYREAGFDPYSVRGIEDLSKLPVVKKDLFKSQSSSELV